MKDLEASRLFYEPLVAYDPEANPVPVLAQEVPSRQNGGVAPDGLSVTWKLTRGVTWHDGRPFTAHDVAFNWEYAADPATATISAGIYNDIARIDKLDSHTIKVAFKTPSPFWTSVFGGNSGQIVPKHLFEGFRGAKAREAPGNLKPIGTGPYRLVEFRPGDALRAELNPSYHVANRPFFDRVELKGGGDAVSAARAVIQTGEFDYAPYTQIEDDILKRMESGGKGRVDFARGADVERIQCNQSDPWTEVDGERASPKTRHPFLTDLAVRSALNLLVDRASIQEQIYGRQGQATANFLNAPGQFQSKNTRWEFNVEKANQLLEAAGWRRGGDGVRAKDGKRLRMVFQSTINAPRQKTQAIVKRACAKAGIEIEIKAVPGSVFLSSDPANPDTYTHFYADLQMFTRVSYTPDPQRFMDTFLSWEIASKENKWTGRNPTRWRSEAFDRLWREAESEMDPIKRASLFIQMNDLVIQNTVVIPVVWRPRVAALSLRLRSAEQSGWDSGFWNLAYWYKV